MVIGDSITDNEATMTDILPYSEEIGREGPMGFILDTLQEWIRSVVGIQTSDFWDSGEKIGRSVNEWRGFFDSWGHSRLLGPLCGYDMFFLIFHFC